MELFPTNVPLPPNPFNQNDDPSLREAYRLCLSMESRHPNDKSLVVPARFLGYLIVELPEAGGRVVAKEVVHLCNCNSTDGDSDEDEMKLRQMFEFYVYRLVGLLKSKYKCTPYSGSPDDELEDRFVCRDVSDEADPAPTDYRTARQSALVRDNFRCVMSGDADMRSLGQMNEKQLEKYHLTRSSYSGHTEYCFIFSPQASESITRRIETVDQPDQNKRRWFSSLPEIIESFDIDLDALKGSGAFSLTNGFTTNISFRHMFEGLEIWFESLPNRPNTYQARFPYKDFSYLQVLPPDKTVTFTSTDPSLPLPDPRYLRYHAAICRVVNLSGANAYLEDLQEELEMAETLAQDGSSMNLLTSCLESVALLT